MRIKNNEEELRSKRIDELSGVEALKNIKNPVKRIKKTSKKKKESVRKLIKKLDTLFAQYVKLRDTDENGYGCCCTCTKSMRWVFDELNDKETNVTNRNFQLGHFIKRERYMTRWHQENTGVQCGLPCNSKVAGKGEQYKFSIYLNERYGPLTSEEMQDMSEIQWKPGLPWLRDQIEVYKSKVQDLLKDKNFTI